MFLTTPQVFCDHSHECPSSANETNFSFHSIHVLLLKNQNERVNSIAFWTGRCTPEVVEVQGSHCFQHRELLHQELEDDHHPVHPSHHLEHVPLIPDLVRKEETLSSQLDFEKIQIVNGNALLSALCKS